MKRPSTAGTEGVAFLYNAQTCRAVVRKRAPAPAFAAEADDRVEQIAAVHTGLLIKSHRSILQVFLSQIISDWNEKINQISA
jgi:hypothetical protein